jgi:hypothetical protein
MWCAWNDLPGAKWKLPATCGPVHHRRAVVDDVSSCLEREEEVEEEEEEGKHAHLVDEDVAVDLAALTLLLLQVLAEALTSALRTTENENGRSDQHWCGELAVGRESLGGRTCSMLSGCAKAQPFLR